MVIYSLLFLLPMTQCVDIRPGDFFSSCMQLSKVDAELNCSGTRCSKVSKPPRSTDRTTTFNPVEALEPLPGRWLGTPQGRRLDEGGRPLDEGSKNITGHTWRLDVGDLQDLACLESADCFTQTSRMVCHRGKCLCPTSSAFNISSCRCERAGVCGEDESTLTCPNHNNRKCRDRFCSCFSSPNFRELLLDPEFLFCVLPLQLGPHSGVGRLWIVFIVLCVLLVVGLFTSILLILLKYFVLEKGDYECDTVDAVPESEVHNATWDYPSLDYIPNDEEIVFTLAQAKDFVGASNASTIHVTDEMAMQNINFDVSNNVRHDAGLGGMHNVRHDAGPGGVNNVRHDAVAGSLNNVRHDVRFTDPNLNKENKAYLEDENHNS